MGGFVSQKPDKKKILFVAMTDSIHTYRWVSQIDQSLYDIYIFSSSNYRPHQKFTALPRISGFFKTNHHFAIIGFTPFDFINRVLTFSLTKLFGTSWHRRWLSKTIQTLKPDIVHSLEFQAGGYLTLDAQQSFEGKFPRWIATNWGSDIYYFSQFDEHRTKIQAVLKHADCYSAECERDYGLAKELGFKGTPMPVIPNAGGIDLKKIEPLRSRVAPLARKTIIIKGYESTFGRAITVLKALELCADKLKNYEILVFSASPETKAYVQELQKNPLLDIKTVSSTINKISHEEMLNLHANARVYIGNSISDGISTSMLEAIALGTFPIQSCTSCAAEWITHGQTGFIPDPSSEQEIAECLIEALQDDSLIEDAYRKNWETVSSKLDAEKIRKIANSFYEKALA
jgi:glycosyltransferase involved in cell wall biosynthesis